MTPDPVAQALDERIKQEALRQLEGFEPDPHDDDWRIDPLPGFGDPSPEHDPSNSEDEAEERLEVDAESVDRGR